MQLKCHLHTGFDAWFADELRLRLGDGIILTTGQELPETPDYHVIISGRPPREWLEASPNLHTLVIPWAGLPVKTGELLVDFPNLRVHNLHHNAAPTAEMAVTLMLAAARSLIPLDRHLRQHDWSPRYLPDSSVLLSGKTALILGYGAIGRRVARACQGLDMRVIGVKRGDVDGRENGVRLVGISHLAEVLPQADVLHICVPLTNETTGLLGKEELALLPDGAIVVNIARGPVIDEAALYRALLQRRIRAGLDVWYQYPKEPEDREQTPVSEFPFHELDNVVMSPHIAGNAASVEELRLTELARVLNAIAAGGDVPNRVDVSRGY